MGCGTLIGVKNYKSLVKSGETVHWATLHCLQLPELLQQLPLNRRQVQWTAINSLKVPSSFFCAKLSVKASGDLEEFLPSWLLLAPAHNEVL